MAGNVANLRPAKKGEVRNPKGRNQHVSPEIKELARSACPAALKKLISLINSPDERVAMVAAKEVLDRGYGRVSQVDDGSGKNGNVTINIVRFEEPEPSKPAQIEASAVRIADFGDVQH